MKITEIVAWVSASAFLLTVVYIFAVSLTIGVDLFLYISFNDYLKLSLCWLPKHLLAVLIVFIMPALLYRLITGKSVHPRHILSLPSEFTTFKKQLFRVSTISILLISTIAIFSLNYYLQPERSIFILCTVFVIYLWLPLVRYKKEFSFIKQYSDWKQYVFSYGPIYLILVFISGLYIGKRELYQIDKQHNTHIEMTSEEPMKRGKVLFAFSQYIVFLEQKTKTVDIIPVGQVKNIINLNDKSKTNKQLEEAKRK